MKSFSDIMVKASDTVLTSCMAEGLVDTVEEYIKQTNRLPKTLDYIPSGCYSPFALQKDKFDKTWWTMMPLMSSPLPTLLLQQKTPSLLDKNFQSEEKCKSKLQVLKHCLSSPVWKPLCDLSCPIPVRMINKKGDIVSFNETYWNMAVSSLFPSYEEHMEFLSYLASNNLHQTKSNAPSTITPLGHLITHLDHYARQAPIPSVAAVSHTLPHTHLDRLQSLLSDFLQRAQKWGAQFSDHDIAFGALIDVCVEGKTAPAKKKIHLLETLKSHGMLPTPAPDQYLDQTALFKAIKHGEGDVSAWLVQNGSSVLQVCPHTKNTMILAAIKTEQSLKVFKRVGSSFAKNVNAQNNQGQTPLHQATLSLSLPVVDYLLSLKADPNIADHKGRFPHHLQSRGLKTHKNWQKILSSLKKAGATELSALEYLKQGCLTLSPPLVEKALRMGANPAHMFETKTTALHLALSAIKTSSFDFEAAKPLLIAQHKIAMMLLNHNAQATTVLLSLPNKEGYTPLHLCVDRGLDQLADACLERGAKNEENTVLTVRPSQMMTSFVPFDPNARTNPLTEANLKIFRVFLKHNIPLDEYDFLRLRHNPEYEAHLLNKQIKNALNPVTKKPPQTPSVPRKM